MNIDITENTNVVLPLNECKECLRCELEDKSYYLNDVMFTTYICKHREACKYIAGVNKEEDKAND